MWILTALVVFVGVLGLLNLVLTLGVIRRLREHTELISSRPPQAPDAMLPAGTTIADFVATTLDGGVVTREDISDMTLVAFLSPACDLCEEQVPLLLERAREMPGGRDRVWVVVVGKGEETQPYAERFREVATVFIEPANAPLPLAFSLNGYPAFGLVDRGGTVLASTFGISRLDLPVAR
jgi:hypothetical protein